MKLSKVNLLLFVSILVMALLPLLTSLYFVDSAVNTSLNLGFNSQISSVLDEHAADLKLLARLDAGNQSKYKRQFEQAQNLRTVYQSGDFIRKTLHHSLLIYFSVGLVFALVIATVAAALLSRKISVSFRLAHDQLRSQEEKIRYLEEISSWQELAKILAHEIKNPLTPIEMLVTSLEKNHREQPAERFAEFIANTQKIILEEVVQLKNIVQKFGAFAHLPSIQMIEVDVCTTLLKLVESLNATATNAQIVFAKSCVQREHFVNLDVSLFRQVLSNLVVNGTEANPDSVTIFSVTVSYSDNVVSIEVMNDGVAVDPAIAPRMFDPYISTKRTKDSAGSNMGLGLAIVRKIMLEHSGDIRYEERNGFPVFILTLPRVISHD